MTYLFCILVLVAVIAATWFLGFWNNIIIFVNLLFAAIIASNYFEPVASGFDSLFPTTTYFVDFIAIWMLFIMTYGILRITTDTISRHQMKFHPLLERIGRVASSLVISWVFICFTFFTLQLAPLPVDAIQATPDTKLLVVGPDRMWLSFMHSRSRGALSASIEEWVNPKYDTSTLHPDDQDLNCRVFDSGGEFLIRYHNRRARFATQSTLFVKRSQGESRVKQRKSKGGRGGGRGGRGGR